MNKKRLLLIIIFTIIIIIGIKVASDLFSNGYAHYGDVWQDTPEKALLRAADDTIDSEQSLTIKHLLETKDIDDITIMTFVSKGDTLVTVTFVTNEKGQYSVYGYTEEVFLDSPTEFLLNGDPDQFILFPYNQYNSTVWGWCYSGASFTINESIPSKKTYVFDSQEKKWSIDFWWIENVPSNVDVQIEYISD